MLYLESEAAWVLFPLGVKFVTGILFSCSKDENAENAIIRISVRMWKTLLF